MERFARQPAACVISDNVLLGGTPTTVDGKLTATAAPELIITDGTARYEGYVPTSQKENNYFAYDHTGILPGAAHYNYDLGPAAKEALKATLSPEGFAMIEAIDWRAAGLSFEYPYLSGTR